MWGIPYQCRRTTTAPLHGSSKLCIYLVTWSNSHSVCQGMICKLYCIIDSDCIHARVNNIYSWYTQMHAFLLSVCYPHSPIAFPMPWYSVRVRVLPISFPFEHCVLRERVRSRISLDKRSRKFEKERSSRVVYSYFLRANFSQIHICNVHVST